MSPMMIRVMLHFYAMREPYSGPDSAKAANQAIAELCSYGLLKESPDTINDYVATDKGRVYVEALIAVPLPVQTWVIPQ